MLFFPNFGYGLHRALYVSRALMDMRDEAAIAALVARAAANNRARNVTGALLVCDDHFIQVLEGAREAVQPLFDAIAADPRHTEVALKLVEPAPRRLFARWGMKQGRAPAEGARFDVSAASSEDLMALLKLSTLAPASKAA